jgi:hypothetical protein
MKHFILLTFTFSSWFFSFGQVNSIGAGNGIRFDGVDDYIDLGNIYDNLELPVTISVWVYIETTDPITLPIFDSQDNSNIYNGFTMIMSNYPHVGLTYGDGKGGNNPAFRASKASFFNYLPGRWVNAAGVIRGAGDMDIYLNGHRLAGQYEGSSTEPMNSNSPSEVAKIAQLFSNGQTFRFKGIMDELRIWHRDLSEGELRTWMCRRLMGTESDLIGYWRFDEVTGDKVLDSSGNGFDGILKGNPQRVFSGAPIGDESTYRYTNDWSGIVASLDDITIKDISDAPFGIHIYKVKSAPSQTSGLEGGSPANYYYGIFLAHDELSHSFDLTLNNSSCKTFVRNDNSVGTWNENAKITFAAERTEIISLSELISDEVDLGADVLACAGTSIVLDSGLDPDNREFKWNTGSNMPTLEVSSSGLYFVEVWDGCLRSKDSVVVSFIDPPSPFSLGNDSTICRGAQFVLGPVEDTPGLEFTWQDGSHKSSFQVQKEGTYELTVKNECGDESDEVTFKKFDPGFQPPNVITPNSDEWNQFFALPVEDGPLILSIYNRWGREVYHSDNYQNNFSGEGLTSGTFYYHANHRCLGEFKGILSIIR